MMFILKHSGYIVTGVLMGMVSIQNLAAKSPLHVDKNSLDREPSKSRVSPEVQTEAQLQRALDLGKNGNYQEASVILHRLLLGAVAPERKMQIRYILGLMLYEMRLDQVAAFQFIEVIRDGNSNYVKKSLEKLSMAASALDNDTLLSFALSKATLSEFPKSLHDMLYFRIGEIQKKRGSFNDAIDSFSRVRSSSEWYPRAKYLQGLSYVETNRLDEGFKSFNEMSIHQGSRGVTNRNFVAAQIGLARVRYQQKKWDSAIEAYRQIPRDSDFWHDAVFEQSWAYLQAAQFRNALSHLHSLHSPFYEDYYIPETVLMRAIVYLYICQYEEMAKTLDFFEKTYRPVLRKVVSFLKTETSATSFFAEISKSTKNTLLRAPAKDEIPRSVSRTLLREGDLQRTGNYIQKLESEKKKIEELPATWRRSSLGLYATKVINARLVNSKIVAGRQVQAHLIRLKKELEELFEQVGFARYELARGRKEAVQKQLVEKKLEGPRIDDTETRDFYVQNGFEYWPFSGEYWWDEIGNYHYLGTKSCE